MVQDNCETENLLFFARMRTFLQPLLKRPSSAFIIRFVAGLLRLKGAYDPTPDLEEMRREKEEADKEQRVSVRSLVGLHTNL